YWPTHAPGLTGRGTYRAGLNMEDHRAAMELEQHGFTCTPASGIAVDCLRPPDGLCADRFPPPWWPPHTPTDFRSPHRPARRVALSDHLPVWLGLEGAGRQEPAAPALYHLSRSTHHPGYGPHRRPRAGAASADNTAPRSPVGSGQVDARSYSRAG